MVPARLKALAPLIALGIFIATLALIGSYAALASTDPAPSAKYALYTNDRWHFSLAVPANMTFAEYDGPESSQTVQFTDQAADKLFQITGLPYMQMDVALGTEGTPSGASDQSTTLGIIDVHRDDTVAYTFHRNGIAYTVTTLRGSESWLLPILQSWEFTN
jgi:hypothetical protein